jgi:ATP-dependent Clp protease ATP-binding subunit ClpC
MRAHWEQEKATITRIREIKEGIEQARTELERAEREADLEGAARLRYGTLPELERALDAANDDLAAQQASRKMLKEEVDEEDVAEVVAAWTGVPVSRLMEGEVEKLLHMEERLHERVIGQDDAVSAVANALRRARAGLSDPNRPIGSFIFLGPTGVGKTELARALAEFMFGSEEQLIKIDMSEFQERHTTSRLVGSPPGYVGYGEGGELTDAVRRKPYSVVLFDEIEKAHPDAFNLLLQVLEDGHLTDGKGRRVDFRNTLIIMTSNVGTEHIRRASRIGFSQGMSAEIDQDDVRRKVDDALKQLFRPEFLNRIDSSIIFHPLTTSEIHQISRILLRRVQVQLKEHGLLLEVHDDAVDLLAKRGYDPAFGARPLRRIITNLIEDPLSDGLLEGRFSAGDTVIVNVATLENGETYLQLRPARELRDADVDVEPSPEADVPA